MTYAHSISERRRGRAAITVSTIKEREIKRQFSFEYHEVTDRHSGGEGWGVGVGVGCWEGLHWRSQG